LPRTIEHKLNDSAYVLIELNSLVFIIDPLVWEECESTNILVSETVAYHQC